MPPLPYLVAHWVNVAIFTRLVTRFRLALSPTVPEPMALKAFIQPVTQVDELLQTPNVTIVTKSLVPGGAIHVVYYTVPQGKRWRVAVLFRDGVAGTTAMHIYKDASNLCQISKYQAAEDVVYPNNVILEPGWSLTMRSTSQAADNVIKMGIVYSEEDAY